MSQSQQQIDQQKMEQLQQQQQKQREEMLTCNDINALKVLLDNRCYLSSSKYYFKRPEFMKLILQYQYTHNMIQYEVHECNVPETIYVLYTYFPQIVSDKQLELLSKDIHIRMINDLGFGRAKSVKILHKYLLEYTCKIIAGTWNGEEIKHADPMWRIEGKSATIHAIDDGQHDNVGKLIDICLSVYPKEMVYAGYDAMNILMYSVFHGKYECTKMILNKLGDISHKMQYEGKDLDVLEFCCIKYDIRTLQLFIDAGHVTYSPRRDGIDLHRFISRFDYRIRINLWNVISKKYRIDRESWNEPMHVLESYRDVEFDGFDDMSISNAQLISVIKNIITLHDNINKDKN